MEALDQDRLEAVFGALSDRTRRALLARLSSSPMSVTQLARPFDMSLPAVSKHLRVLEQAGLVQRTIQGRVHRCSLEAGPLADAGRWLSEYQVFWEHSLDALAAFVTEEAEEDA